MKDDNNDIEKILAEREKIDNVLKSKFSKKISIMFTDIKGSTSVYDIRGDIDGRVMVHRHNEIVLPIIGEHHGELLKTIGDATMSVFDEPVDAMNAAISIQKGLKAFNSDKPEKEQIHVRVGLNFGTAIVDKGDVFGDVVNVASRVESLADTDEIFITESLYREVRHHDEFIFRYVEEAKMKGKQDSIRVYRVVWHEEDLFVGQTRSAVYKKEGLFVFEASVSGNKLKVSGFERAEGEERPVKGYKEITFHEQKIKSYTQGIIDVLNRANRRGKIGTDLLVKLKELGGLMFDELIPVNVKDKLIQTSQENLLISIDDKLVYIPWELLYDGKDFLCQRFSIGRSVSTRQQVSVEKRALGRPLKMQLLVDPGGDLRASYEEGVGIKNEIGQQVDWLNISLKSTEIKTDYVKAKIRNFDIVHYAGHAEHNASAPEKSGWVLSDGKLSAKEIMHLKGAMPMPSLVFSNACQSGHSEEWKIEKDYEDKIFGLANSFLLSGVQHYIGTFWEIPDEAGLYFAIVFYKNIIQGVTIGEAMRSARAALIDRYGEDTIVWASYMLYGDPTTRYVRKDMQPYKTAQKSTQPATETLVASGFRHKEEVIHLREPKKSSSQFMYAGIAALLIAVIALVMYTVKGQQPSNGSTVTVVSGTDSAAESESMKRERINTMVAALAQDYREGAQHKTATSEDDWSSRPLTMVLMNIQSSSTSGEGSRERLMNLLPMNLMKVQRINMVEREILDKLLEELQLGTSELADPMTSLRLGKVLSANIILTGRIISNGAGQTIMLRAIDTETTVVRKIISAESPASTIDASTINDLSTELIRWVKADFPLHGKILVSKGNTCEINLGRMHGLEKGVRFEILTKDEEGKTIAGEIVVEDVGNDRSRAVVEKGDMQLKDGAMIREKTTT
jgi:class 3 adenylate cyclase/CHAT domain-containing protein